MWSIASLIQSFQAVLELDIFKNADTWPFTVYLKHMPMCGSDLFWPYPSEWLQRFWCNHTVALLPVKKPWRIWFKKLPDSPRNGVISTRKNDTKAGAYLVEFTISMAIFNVLLIRLSIPWQAPCWTRKPGMSYLSHGVRGRNQVHSEITDDVIT